MSFETMIQEYLAGPELLRKAVQGMSEADLQARPVPGTWSSQEVVCHLADFEPIYADRMKRVIAEESPLLLSGSPDLFSTHLCYGQRDVAEELDLITAVRRQMARILAVQPESALQRAGRHSEDGPISLEQLLNRITNHLPHHVKFIHQKRTALGLD